MTDARLPFAPQPILVDRFGRRITYLRLSVTDRCDFRCVYCMGRNQRFAPREAILTLEELFAIARTFVYLGVRKIRLTGGEPLVRRNLTWLIRRIHALPGLDELVMTSNGSQLAAKAREIREAGVRRINISLDSLRPERFRRITRYGCLREVLSGIDAAIAAGFERIKLNSVILSNRNQDEVVDLVRFAVDRNINISFIEEMPIGAVGDHNHTEGFYSSDRIHADLDPHFTLIPTTETTGGPARYYRIPESQTRVGFISPHSHNFCADCNRVRVTSGGQLLLCLGNDQSLDLRAILRDQLNNGEGLPAAILQSMQVKPRGHTFGGVVSAVDGRFMNVTGGRLDFP